MSAPAATGTSTRTGRGLWWLSPAGLLGVLIPTTVLLTGLLSDAVFRLQYRTPKSVTTETLLLVAVACLVLAGAATLAAGLARGGGTPLLLDRGVRPQLRSAARVLFWATVVGYTAFYVAGFARGLRPAQVLEILISQDNYGVSLRDYFGGVPGLTTLTQCGIAFVVVATYVLRREHDRRLAAQVVVVLLLTLLRSYVNNERLALIEVAIPAIVVLAMTARNDRRRSRRVAARFGPLALAPLLFLLFAVFEYSRSWQYFESRTDLSFLEFMVVRFAGYYATAYNNGQLQLLYADFPGRLPRDSLQAFWEAPVIAQLGLYDRLSAPVPTASDSILEQFGNPEFNNPGGVTTPFVDFGPVGGLLFMAVLGAVLGLLYRRFVDGEVVGALLYPVAFTGLLDLPRYLYWTQGRVTPALAGLLAVAYVIVRAERRERSRAAAHRRSLGQRVVAPTGGSPG
ncbi:oligosaccharide repeat unit polymerase [Geodermatophilus pulveris]|uniref:Oligosaccharide repeat unit polymerase n=1 Tax=Geodermatophilus pulveris TaxID=1564159 RepID=A0A239J895_9ACTN|nr:oligosaccharide repeat unit polymerase [Geodermatophilus pulveris]SNT01728.1 oligosaccharide repeat unit polymerase [Geodermatophilus pulveris]